MHACGGFGRVWLSAAPRTAARHTPLSMGFSRQEHWSGLPGPPPGDLPDPGVKPTSLRPLALAGGFLRRAPPGKQRGTYWLARPHPGTRSDFSCFQFSHSVMSNSLRRYEQQHARPPCPSPTPRVHSCFSSAQSQKEAVLGLIWVSCLQRKQIASCGWGWRGGPGWAASG